MRFLVTKNKPNTYDDFVSTAGDLCMHSDRTMIYIHDGFTPGGQALISPISLQNILGFMPIDTGSLLNQPNGIATLDENGKLQLSQTNTNTNNNTVTPNNTTNTSTNTIDGGFF